LVEYSIKKALESNLLGAFLPNSSCLAPADYNTRFRRFIYKFVFGE
jgi:hypothetical protein